MGIYGIIYNNNIFLNDIWDNIYMEIFCNLDNICILESGIWDSIYKENNYTWDSIYIELNHIGGNNYICRGNCGRKGSNSMENYGIFGMKYIYYKYHRHYLLKIFLDDKNRNDYVYIFRRVLDCKRNYKYSHLFLYDINLFYKYYNSYFLDYIFFLGKALEINYLILGL